MARHWTPEERQRQAALIRNWRPWDHSTGPKTAEGKAASAGNSTKHGERSAECIAAYKRVNDVLRRYGDLLKGVK